MAPASPSLRLARLLALAVPASLLGGALISQYVFGLYPCEMCMWQRYPHYAALALVVLGFTVEPRRLWIGLAGLAILGSGLIGAFHAGVEYGWWEGLTACTLTADTNGADALEAIMDAPLVRCDAPQWSLFGVSLAGWNFLFSTVGGLAVLRLLFGKDA